MALKKILSVTLAFAFVLSSQSVLSGYKPIEELTGTASFYSKNLEGSKTATGEVFSNTNYTAASNFFKLNTWVKVTNLKNLKTVIVRINDRMHPKMAKKGRVIDLSRSAAVDIAMLHHGLAKVKLEVVDDPLDNNEID